MLPQSGPLGVPQVVSWIVAVEPTLTQSVLGLAAKVVIVQSGFEAMIVIGMTDPSDQKVVEKSNPA